MVLPVQDLPQVVARLALLPGTLQQRDGRRDTPVALARRLRRQDAADILRWAAGSDVAMIRPPAGA